MTTKLAMRLEHAFTGYRTIYLSTCAVTISLFISMRILRSLSSGELYTMHDLERAEVNFEII